jgi:uncharacterized protein (TIGR02246 family)
METRMKSFLGACLAILAAATTAVAADAERELTDLENQLAQAIAKGDTAFVSRVFGEDFVYTGVRGEVKAKQDIVAELKSGALKFELIKFDEIKVRPYGETAVVTGIATTKGRSAQGEISGRFRYTRVYVKRQGAWQLVAFQGTPVAAP